MRATNYVIALAAAVGTTATLTLATTSLARVSGVETPDVSTLNRVIGFSLGSAAALLVVHTPCLMILSAFGRCRVGRLAVSIGSAIVIYLAFMAFPVAESGSLSPIVWNVAGWFERPVEFVADWLPFLGGAMVFGAIAWVPKRRTGSNGQTPGASASVEG